MLPKDSAARKAAPLARGCMYYWPDALVAVAELSQKGNDKHNPGEPIRWSREKSDDHADCVARHLIDAGKDWTAVDPEDNVLHAVKVAWRALALAQIAIEKIAAAKPVSDGWIEWKGGERFKVKRPVEAATIVRVKFRDGTEREGQGIKFAWYHDGDTNDVVAYRVVTRITSHG